MKLLFILFERRDYKGRTERLFDKDKCFEKYVELYEDLLNSN